MEQQYSSSSSSSSSFSSKQQEGENSEGGGCQLNIIMSLIKKSILSLQLASLLSLIFLSSSLLFLFLHYSLKAATSSSLSLSSLPAFFSIDRNYMFLLCNGILVFLVKSSSLSSSESSADDKGGRVHDHDRHQSGIHIPASGGMGSGGQGAEEKTGDGHASSAAAESDGADDRERSAPGFDDAAMFHGADNSSTTTNNNNNVQQHSSSEYQQVEESEEEEEEEEEEGLDRDELNKRCEDFIRKMKEGIKAEAKQHMNPAFCFTSLRN